MVLNWHSSGEPRNGKPVVRRPMTACAPCRIARVRCSGKQECDRCASRGLQCVYSTAESKAVAPTAVTNDGPSSSSGFSPATDGTADGSMSGGNSSVFTGFDESLDLADGMNFMDWTDDMFTNALEELDWELPSEHSRMKDHVSLDVPPVLRDGDTLSALNLSTEPSTDFIGQDNTTTADSSSKSGSKRHSILPDTKSPCLCRSLPISHIPELEKMMSQETQETRLEHVLKTTEDVIASCQAAIDCQSCRVGPVDLVCIVSVFQQTAGCFGYITKSMVRSTIKVSVGDYEISVADDANTRRILISNLVKQASTLLDSISKIGQDHIPQQRQQANSRPRKMSRSPACLRQINMEYVQEVVANFRKFFRLITVLDGRQSSQGRWDPR